MGTGTDRDRSYINSVLFTISHSIGVLCPSTLDRSLLCYVPAIPLLRIILYYCYCKIFSWEEQEKLGPGNPGEQTLSAVVFIWKETPVNDGCKIIVRSWLYGRQGIRFLVSPFIMFGWVAIFNNTEIHIPKYAVNIARTRIIT